MMQHYSCNIKIHFVSLEDHGTSSSPSSSGAPTECSAGTKKASVSDILSNTSVPMRAIMRIDSTTYGLSVISTPYLGSLASSGPITKGTTYMVRPRMAPSNASLRMAFISAGSFQLLVKPASSSFSEQINVRDSTRATSAGSEKAA